MMELTVSGHTNPIFAIYGKFHDVLDAENSLRDESKMRLIFDILAPILELCIDIYLEQELA